MTSGGTLEVNKKVDGWTDRVLFVILNVGNYGGSFGSVRAKISRLVEVNCNVGGAGKWVGN